MKTKILYTRTEPATGRQRRYIAQLCMRLGESAPVEEYPMTEGEAGSLIRRLERRLEIKRESRRKGNEEMV